MGRRVSVGVSVGAGVEVGARRVTVGEAVDAGVVGTAAGVWVPVLMMGGGVGVGGGVETVTQLLIPHPPVAMQAAIVTPANVRRVAASQSGGVGICTRAAWISVAV
jgi:hypothetical protein